MGAARLYEEWYRTTKGQLYCRVEQEAFVRRIPVGASVLELGCGTGRITRAIAKRASYVIALDFSKKSLEVVASAGCSNIELHEHDIRIPFSFLSEPVDFVVACQVLQHLRSDDMARVIGHAHDALKPGGRFVFSVYNSQQVLRRLPKWQLHPLYIRRFSRQDLLELVGETPFRSCRPQIRGLICLRGYRLLSRFGVLWPVLVEIDLRIGETSLSPLLCVYHLVELVK